MLSMILENVTDILERESKRTQVNIKSVDKLARNIVKEYGSNYDAKKLSNELLTVFEFMNDRKTAGGDFS